MQPSPIRETTAPSEPSFTTSILIAGLDGPPPPPVSFFQPRLLPPPLLLPVVVAVVFSKPAKIRLGAPSSARLHAPKVGMYKLSPPALAVAVVLVLAFAFAFALAFAFAFAFAVVLAVASFTSSF